MYYMGHYEVAVIGAGHAGVEAALAAARLGCKPLYLPFLWIKLPICPVIRLSAEQQKDTWFEK